MSGSVLKRLEEQLWEQPPEGFTRAETRKFLRRHRATLLRALAPLSGEPTTLAEVLSYDVIIVAFSGGKDSLGCLLHLLRLGVPPARIELWHHEVDGREGSHLMDWPCTKGYVEAVAAALGCPLYFSWKDGGFEKEMLRDGEPSAPTRFETPEGLAEAGGAGELGTRRQFPQVSRDLSVRWCSAYLKIDVAAIAIRNQARFQSARVLVLTGERAEESEGRAHYAAFEPHRTDLARDKKTKQLRLPPLSRRHVDHWRPLLAWSEQEVWALIEDFGVAPHPAYELGYSRVSCAGCIFGNEDQFATLRAASPAQWERLARYEEAFGKTIKPTVSLRVLTAQGTPYAALTPERARAALSREFAGPVLLGSRWELPAGAYGDSSGPT